ncbi:cobalamin biosynthesis protein [Microvirga massiliensis]|uniref:cobalamin biosynthesis protein n=1 Tax=Microvirga massiliensis TaxID=1033741 RepID=UPI0006603009|nr:cobalamin biosynthesis protein [Microvirga massiliensis]
MIVAGVGFRSSVDADEIVALVERALLQAALQCEALDRLATIEPLAAMPPFVEAARRLSTAPVGVERAALEGAAHAVQTISARALAAHGVGSVAEAAALGAVGSGAVLVLKRITSAAATCALARDTTTAEEAHS